MSGGTEVRGRQAAAVAHGGREGELQVVVVGVECG
jgi:hypothetical protein